MGGTTVPTTTTDKPKLKTSTKRCDTRTKMLVSAAQVMRERGAAGVTIDEVLARSGAPRGSVYYHFPEGRNQILTEALRYSGDSITEMIDDAAGWGAKALLGEFIDFWERTLSEGDFAAGCPVVAAAIGSDDDPNLSVEAGEILRHWCAALTRAFVTDGFEEPCAASLSVMSIAALEGAVVLARSTRSVEPLRQVGEQLEFLIKAREFVVRNKIAE
ncbi:TetR/AcrR family transcriptional regulator [Mycobacterium sp. Marseille-P9652]|uniref:TetR/AcrR family transcriptional regulator n=1 Tax=Mycobacterium sp. Marseille-P9652 TaxID=2654950 RepID=UPI004037EC6A